MPSAKLSLATHLSLSILVYPCLSLSIPVSRWLSTIISAWGQPFDFSNDYLVALPQAVTFA